MFVQVQDNYLAIYPFYCFGSLNRSFFINECKRIFVFMCFTVQLSRFLSFFFISDSLYIISKLFLFVKNFFNFFVAFELFNFLLLLFQQLVYIIIFSVICQQLFLFADNINKVLYFLCHLSATTLILYHSCRQVSTFFLFKFKYTALLLLNLPHQLVVS